MKAYQRWAFDEHDYALEQAQAVMDELVTVREATCLLLQQVRFRSFESCRAKISRCRHILKRAYEAIGASECFNEEEGPQ